MHGDATRSIHADRPIAELPDVAPAIRPSTTFTAGGQRSYRRDGHETTERFEAVIGSLDGGHAVAYPSGMAAVSAVLDRLAPRAIHLPDEVYHGVRSLTAMRARATDLRIVDVDELQAGDIWWVETPSNPRCGITDLAAVAEEATASGVVTVCDATLATPALLRPLSFGIDIVVHAATKAIAGHSDALAGLVVVGSAEEAAVFRKERSIRGSVPGSLDMWLALRGVRTLPLRMARASENAEAVARWCDGRSIPTFHPGLETHPGHDVARRQMSAMGSIVTIDLGAASRADRFIGALGIFTNATSLGGVESLVERRAVSDPSMDPGIVRMSIGIEDIEDLIADLEQAMAAIA
jgi:cystathionine gamma-synthase